VSQVPAELARARAPVLALELDGVTLPALIDELDQTRRDFAAPFERDHSLWNQAPPGKWSGGQHVEHVGGVLAIGADALERAADLLLRGDLGSRPWRDPLQWLFVRTVTRRFPRGGKAPSGAVPGAAPERAATMARLAQGALRHRTLCERLTVGQRDRLWIWNPYAPRLRWHYTFAEEVRVQTTHARHHMKGAFLP
jgi:hypothetical protein